MAGFQKQVGRYLAPAADGSWASFNPYYSLLEPSDGDLNNPTSVSWRVGASGAVVGRFAFANDDTGEVDSICPVGGIVTTDDVAGNIRIGFVQRAQPVVITEFLGAASLSLYEGQNITLISKGDVWTRFMNDAKSGQFVYANLLTGQPIASSNKQNAPSIGFTGTTANGSADVTVADPSQLAVGLPVTGVGIADGSTIQSITGSKVTLSAPTTADGTDVQLYATIGAITSFRVASTAGAGELAKISAGA